MFARELSLAGLSVKSDSEGLKFSKYKTLQVNTMFLTREKREASQFAVQKSIFNFLFEDWEYERPASGGQILFSWRQMAE